MYSETVWARGRGAGGGGRGWRLDWPHSSDGRGLETQCAPDARPTRKLATVWADQMLDGIVEPLQIRLSSRALALLLFLFILRKWREWRQEQ